MEIFIFWLFFSIVAGIIANNKGRSGFGFFLLSVILSPVIGVIGALIAKPDQASVEQVQIKEGGMKRCPFCAEIIKNKAIVCKHCGKDLPVISDVNQEKTKETNHFDHYEAQFGIKRKDDPEAQLSMSDLYADPAKKWFKKK